MSTIAARTLLHTDSITVRDVVCGGECRHRSEAETAAATNLVFTYRGLFLRHVGAKDVVAEPNQLLFFNAREEYRISHPLDGGDACLSLTLSENLLDESAPKDQLLRQGSATFARPRRRIDAHAQLLAATLRHSLKRDAIDALEAEILTLALVRRALGERTSHATRASAGRQKLVDRTKLVLSSNLTRRWSLSEIGAEMGVSPVYLTQIFQQVEGVPLSRYHLRLRLARALDLLDRYEDLTSLGLDLGFSSHSHFTATFRQAFGRTPQQFRRANRLR